jgi:hypothetical protein
MRYKVLLLTVSVMLGVALQASAAGFLTVADFDIPPPNNLGGGFGAFSPSASETTYVTSESVDDMVKHGNEGGAMRLDYNVDKAGSFNGFWMKLGPEDVGNNFDASKYSALTFWVKGDTKKGIPSSFKIELKGDPGARVGRQYVKSVSGSWKKISLSLKKYADQGVDLGSLNELVIVFENSVASPGTEGRIWIDTIAFEE